MNTDPDAHWRGGEAARLFIGLGGILLVLVGLIAVAVANSLNEGRLGEAMAGRLRRRVMRGQRRRELAPQQIAIALLLVGAGAAVALLAFFAFTRYEASGDLYQAYENGQAVGGPQERAKFRSEAMAQALPTFLAVPAIFAGAGVFAGADWRDLAKFAAGAVALSILAILPLSLLFDKGAAFAFDPRFTLFVPLLMLGILRLLARVNWAELG